MHFCAYRAKCGVKIVFIFLFNLRVKKKFPSRIFLKKKKNIAKLSWLHSTTEKKKKEEEEGKKKNFTITKSNYFDSIKKKNIRMIYGMYIRSMEKKKIRV